MTIAELVVIICAVGSFAVTTAVAGAGAWMFAKATQAAHAARLHGATADSTIETFTDVREPDPVSSTISQQRDDYVAPTKEDFLEVMRARREMAAAGVSSNGHSAGDIGSTDANDAMPPDFGPTDVGGHGDQYRGS